MNNFFNFYKNYLFFIYIYMIKMLEYVSIYISIVNENLKGEKMMKFKFILFSFVLILSISTLSENNLKDFFNIDIFKKNSTNEKTFYYPNGQLKSRQFFIKGKKSGVWEYFHENGKPKSVVTFFSDFSDKESGKVINYDRNGIILSDGKFIDDVMVSLWNYYDENGKKIYSIDYKTGKINLFNENEELILRLSEEELSTKIQEIQEEIKNDRIRSTEE